MKTPYIISCVAFLLMIGCWVAYSLSPNYVADDGMLVESFGFIPMGWLFALIGIVSLIVGIFFMRKKSI